MAPGERGLWHRLWHLAWWPRASLMLLPCAWAPGAIPTGLPGPNLHMCRGVPAILPMDALWAERVLRSLLGAGPSPWLLQAPRGDPPKRRELEECHGTGAARCPGNQLLVCAVGGLPLWFPPTLHVSTASRAAGSLPSCEGCTGSHRAPPHLRRAALAYTSTATKRS